MDGDQCACGHVAKDLPWILSSQKSGWFGDTSFGVEGRVKMGSKTMEMRGRWDDRWGTIPDYTTGEVAITRKYQPLFLWSVLTF